MECGKQKVANAIPCWSTLPYAVISSFGRWEYIFFSVIAIFSPPLTVAIQWPTKRMASDEEFPLFYEMAPLKLCKNQK